MGRKRCSREGCERMAWTGGLCYRHANEGKEKKPMGRPKPGSAAATPGETGLDVAIGPRLKELRKAFFAQGIRRPEFGQRSGLGTGNISAREEKGISRRRAREVAAALGCSEAWLLDGVGEMFPASFVPSTQNSTLSTQHSSGPPPGPKDEKPAMDKRRANKVRPKSDPFDDLMAQQVVRCCRVCGCTEDHACPGGCAWIEEPDPETGLGLCSACYAKGYGLTHRVDGNGHLIMEPHPPGAIQVALHPRVTEIYYEDVTLRKGFPVRLGIRSLVPIGADFEKALYELVGTVQRKLDTEVTELEEYKESLREEIAGLQKNRDQLHIEVVETSRTLAGMRTIAAASGD